MDPKACLIEADQHLRQHGERAECAARLVDYFEWRLKGGFEPTMAGPAMSVAGDYYAVLTLQSLGEVADTLAEAIA